MKRKSTLACALLQCLIMASMGLRIQDVQPLPVQTGNALVDRAERNALAVLAIDLNGSTHRAAPFYDMPWLRDSYAWGMVPLDSGVFKSYATTELQYWLRHQRPTGAWISYKYSGWFDETPIFIAAVLDSYRLTGDRAMVKQALPQLRLGWHWLKSTAIRPSHGSSCLLWATVGPGGEWATDWADQVARRGYTPQLEGLWFNATHAMAALEMVVGDKKQARSYAHAAACISAGINRMLWRVSSPSHVGAHPVAPFGHYTSMPAGQGYFELDSNALLIASAASPLRRQHVLNEVASNKRYFFGGKGAGPARVVYGEYLTSDYGPIHNWMGVDRYQSAYWPIVGGLLSIAAARNDDTGVSSAIISGMAKNAQDETTAFHEWYTSTGGLGGAADYAWGARMYMLALYRAELGVDDSAGLNDPVGLVFRAVPAPASGILTRLGYHVQIDSYGHGRVSSVWVGAVRMPSYRVPSSALFNGAVVRVYHE